MDQEIRLKSKLWAAISYLGPLCLWSAFRADEDDFIRFHVRQGIVLFIIEFICWVVMIVPILGVIFNVFAHLVLGLFSVFGMIFALSGEYKSLPLIGSLAEKIVL